MVDAVRCAIEVQNGVVERNAGLPPERRIEFPFCDVVEESDGEPIVCEVCRSSHRAAVVVVMIAAGFWTHEHKTRTKEFPMINRRTVLAIITSASTIGVSGFALAKEKHHHNGQALLGDKIKQNGKHKIHTAGKADVLQKSIMARSSA